MNTNNHGQHNQAWTWKSSSLLSNTIYVSYTLYILERLSSWSTSWIHRSWPHPWVRLSLLPVLFRMYPPCLSWYLAVCSNDSCFTHPPSLANGQLNTSTQVNNMAVLHLIYVVTHIYITFTLLFISLFILLLYLWAGWLAPILLVRNKNFTL